MALFVGAGCGGRPLLETGSTRTVRFGQEPIPEVYRIRVGDELEISVWGHEDLARKIRVRSDGTFNFPVAGTVRAQGRSLQELEQELQEKLSRQTALEGESPKTPIPSTKVIPASSVSNEVYTLRFGDELKISVWNHSDLDQTVPIREDGSFSFPLIGQVQAAGRSLRGVEQEVVERLDRDYIVNPQVTVQLTGSKFTILGEVASPGSYPIEGSLDLLTALSRAGGLTKYATNRVEIIRERTGDKVAIEARVDRILEGQQPNVQILPRDAIHVIGSPLVTLQVSVRLAGAKFSVLGEVERPGSYFMEGTIDLLTAIGEAGGITKFGSSRIEVIRVQGEEKVTIRMNLDRVLAGKEPNIQILPHDTIYVRRRIF